MLMCTYCFGVRTHQRFYRLLSSTGRFSLSFRDLPYSGCQQPEQQPDSWASSVQVDVAFLLVSQSNL
ncbi:MAG: hypothetical protein ACTS73_08540 [Arsenophonus sp. NEOnobi-MAG3]